MTNWMLNIAIVELFVAGSILLVGIVLAFTKLVFVFVRDIIWGVPR